MRVLKTHILQKQQFRTSQKIACDAFVAEWNSDNRSVDILALPFLLFAIVPYHRSIRTIFHPQKVYSLMLTNLEFYNLIINPFEAIWYRCTMHEQCLWCNNFENTWCLGAASASYCIRRILHEKMERQIEVKVFSEYFIRIRSPSPPSNAFKWIAECIVHAILLLVMVDDGKWAMLVCTLRKHKHLVYVIHKDIGVQRKQTRTHTACERPRISAKMWRRKMKHGT